MALVDKISQLFNEIEYGARTRLGCASCAGRKQEGNQEAVQGVYRALLPRILIDHLTQDCTQGAAQGGSAISSQVF